jgi:tetratricopeptide (TPR) repeat protein
VADNPRIDELRRRVVKDPASIAFAQLAEEYRRAGSYEDAIEACRSGLAIHPGYLSARVTLGRALLEMNDLDSALGELEYVLKAAPENLAAIRGVAEIHHRRGALGEALGFYKAALALARHDPDLEQTVDEISRALSPERPLAVDGLSFEQASAEFLMALEDLPGGLEAALVSEPPASIASFARIATGQPPVLPKLERFLDAIHTRRQKKAV